MDDLDVLEPTEVKVVAGGRTFTVRPLTVGQLPAFARALRPVLPALQRALGGNGAVDPAAIADLIADHGDALIDAVAIAAGAKRKDVEALDPLAFIELATPVIRVNADFFSRRLRPAVAAAAQAMTHGAGSTSSSP